MPGASHTNDSSQPAGYHDRPKTSGRWSGAANWGSTPPQAGAEVAITAGTDVVLDESTEALKSLQIDGTLSFKAAHDYERMNNPAVLELRRKVRLQQDE